MTKMFFIADLIKQYSLLEWNPHSFITFLQLKQETKFKGELSKLTFQYKLWLNIKQTLLFRFCRSLKLHLLNLAQNVSSLLCTQNYKFKQLYFKVIATAACRSSHSTLLRNRSWKDEKKERGTRRIKHSDTFHRLCSWGICLVTIAEHFEAPFCLSSSAYTEQLFTQ